MKHKHPKIIRSSQKLRDQLGTEWIENAAEVIRDEIDSEIINQLRKIKYEKEKTTS